VLLTFLNNLIMLHQCSILLQVSYHPWVVQDINLLILFLISSKINRVFVIMLNKLINKTNMWRFRLKFCLLLISCSLIFLITHVKWIADMSKIIKLNWVCLEDIKILVCVILQIILISVDLGLLLTKHSILLQIELSENRLLLVQYLDFFLLFSMRLLLKYWLLVIILRFIIVIWRILLDSFFAFQSLSRCQRPRINSIVHYLIVFYSFLLECLLTL
jgi:hypothetical protein